MDTPANITGAIPSTPWPPRIALFSGNYNYTVDGANKSLNRLVGHLLNEVGARVRVYSPTCPESSLPYLGDLVSVPSVRIPTRPDYRLALGMPRHVRQDILKFKPNLVHLSSPDLLGIAAQNLAKTLDIPVVTSVHTHFDTYLSYYKIGWMTPFLRRQLQAFYRESDFILAPTTAVADELKRQAERAQVRLWARGVDAPVFHPGRRSAAWRQAHGLDETRPVVVFLGRVVMEKGLAVFVDAIRRLEQAGEAFQVLVIGDGPARPWFQQRLPGAVFTGSLAGDAVATALASGDIFLNPSCTETFGNVNLEAMASGLPLVCADAANTRALLTDACAFLCPPTDAHAYAEAIGRLVRDAALRQRMGAEAHALSAGHRWSDVLDNVVDVYREALDVRPDRKLAA